MVSDTLTCSLFGNIAMTMCFKYMLEGQFKHLTAVRVKTDHIFFSESSMQENLHILPVFYCHLHSLGMWKWCLHKQAFAGWFYLESLMQARGTLLGRKQRRHKHEASRSPFVLLTLQFISFFFLLTASFLKLHIKLLPWNIKMFCATLWTRAPILMSGKDSKRL